VLGIEVKAGKTQQQEGDRATDGEEEISLQPIHVRA
jgi:hypothetical protein